MIKAFALTTLSSFLFLAAAQAEQAPAPAPEVVCQAQVTQLDGPVASVIPVILVDEVAGRFVGKVDNVTIRIDATEWPAILMSLDFEFPQTIDIETEVDAEIGKSPKITYSLNPPGKLGKVQRYLEMICADLTKMRMD
ncbi:hypothetical protein D3C87_571730 [compost metagenome]